MTIGKHQIKVRLQCAQEVKQERKKKVIPKKQSINEMKKGKGHHQQNKKRTPRRNKGYSRWKKKALQNSAEYETQT